MQMQLVKVRLISPHIDIHSAVALTWTISSTCSVTVAFEDFSHVVRHRDPVGLCCFTWFAWLFVDVVANARDDCSFPGLMKSLLLLVCQRQSPGGFCNSHLREESLQCVQCCLVPYSVTVAKCTEYYKSKALLPTPDIP